MIYSPQQQRALAEILPIAEIATDGSRENLSFVNPRCSSLIAGPSGSGKTFLAQRIAEILKLPCLLMNVASWNLLSARAEPASWTVVAEWLSKLPNGGVIVLDEIDKCVGSSDWVTFLRMELFALLDGSIPASVRLPEPSLDFLGANPGELVTPDSEQLEKTLRQRVMVIGCGAWQSAWRTNSRQLGFASDPSASVDPPTNQQILGSIDPELRLRFRDAISVLPPMLPSDYLAVAKTIAARIPPEYLREWQSNVGAAMRRAYEGTLGMRVYEELILTAMVLSRKSLSKDPTEEGVCFDSH